MQMKSCIPFFCLAMTCVPALAVEGKWTPEQLLEHDADWLRELGLELPASKLWSDAGGLLKAIVQINGCSSGFVSSEGLIITNHHCAFSLLQEHSTEERDLIDNGFLAGGREEELHGATSRATVPYRFTDVTTKIEGSVPDGATDLERYLAIERKTKELIASCEEKEFRRCRLASYDDGVRYVLIEALEFRDVRLVWAPPRAVGEFGGEVDNWMWPRHTGDYALLRVYSDADNHPTTHADGNRPYRPKRHLEVARQGVHDGSFVMVVGYPGSTQRRYVAAEMLERYELYFPKRAGLYRDWLDIMQKASEADEAARLALTGRIKGLANSEKNSRGQLAAIDRGNLIEKKRRLDAEVRAFATRTEAHRGALDAYEALEALVSEKRRTFDRDFLLRSTRAGPMPLSHALWVARWAIESEKPDMDRDPDFQERNRDRAGRVLKRDQSRLHLPTETRLLVDWIERVAALEDGQRVSAIDALLATGRRREAIEAKVKTLLSGSKIHVSADRLAMFAENVEQLKARNDPMLALAFALWEELFPIETADKARAGAVSRLRPVWRRAAAAAAGRPVDPDANGTLRVSLAHVKGYSPRDAVWMTPLTRVRGIFEKHTGKEPFDAPRAVLERAGRAPESRWAETTIGDVPVCFLATGDTTGGSSGSPVLNARGELVGVNFDRVWENVANDFGYNPDIARNVSSDVRYLLWMLDGIASPASRALLDELGALERIRRRGSAR